jgi:hypothetical protein
MIYLTQLVYVHPGKEDIFQQFEAVAIPLIAKHEGELVLRIRPNPESVVAAAVEVPYEIHVVRFADERTFEAFARDPERQRFLHLKNESVRTSLLIQGAAL